MKTSLGLSAALVLLTIGFPSLATAQQIILPQREALSTSLPANAGSLIGYQKVCNGKRCFYQPIYAQAPVYSVRIQYRPTIAYVADSLPEIDDSLPDISSTPSERQLAIGEAAHTPMAEVVRVLGLLPKPEIAFVDFGCGYDARWCIAAAERWKCKCIGVEIDPERATAARARVRNLGLDNLITITQGDVATIPVSGDVAVAYLYPDVLTRLRPRLKYFKAFASYLHQPPGMAVTKNGDTWFYTHRTQIVQSQSVQAPQAIWGGVAYSRPVCNSPNCDMCQSIRRQLGLY